MCRVQLDQTHGVSNGNSMYVGADGVRLLFDAGISGRQAEQRLATHGRDIRNVDALVASHAHRDHARCMGIIPGFCLA